jgi:hypothetical protein
MIDSTLYSKTISSMQNLDSFVMHSVGPVLLQKSNAIDVYEVWFLKMVYLFSKNLFRLFLKL